MLQLVFVVLLVAAIAYGVVNYFGRPEPREPIDPQAFPNQVEERVNQALEEGVRRLEDEVERQTSN